ncbi:hypothetical protein AVEN_251704-1 [Araneus ventricosus]|uniref:Uncharacterized protein n=1 Tax=Araneus ventricosus TaxID=182803 RepID=A0A4Y2NAR5_ARAVE|nr:hypothetical protein AVEN_251704-1 [Araneus ventricosus]
MEVKSQVGFSVAEAATKPFHFVHLTSFPQNGFFCSRPPERMQLKMAPDGEDDDRCHIRRKFSRFPSLESYWVFRHLLTGRRQMG